MIAAVIIGLIGDLDGEQSAAVSCLRMLGERGDVQVACQLGDLRFGMGPDPEAYLAAIESVCTEFEIQLLCRCCSRTATSTSRARPLYVFLALPQTRRSGLWRHATIRATYACST